MCRFLCLILGLLTCTPIWAINPASENPTEAINEVENEGLTEDDPVLWDGAEGEDYAKSESWAKKFMEKSMAEAKSVQILKHMAKSAEENFLERMKKSPRIQAEVAVQRDRNKRSESSKSILIIMSLYILVSLTITFLCYRRYIKWRRAMMAAGERPEVYNKYVRWCQPPSIMIFPMIGGAIVLFLVEWYFGPDLRLPQDDTSVAFQVNRILKDMPSEDQQSYYQVALDSLVQISFNDNQHQQTFESEFTAIPPMNQGKVKPVEEEQTHSAEAGDESKKESEKRKEEETDRYAEAGSISLEKHLEILKSLVAATESTFHQFSRIRGQALASIPDSDMYTWTHGIPLLLMVDILVGVIMFSFGMAMNCTKADLDKAKKKESGRQRCCRIFLIRSGWVTAFLGVVLLVSSVYLKFQEDQEDIENERIYKRNFLQAIKTSLGEMDKLEQNLCKASPQAECAKPRNTEKLEETIGQGDKELLAFPKGKLIPEIQNLKQRLGYLEDALFTLEGRFVQRFLRCKTHYFH